MLRSVSPVGEDKGRRKPPTAALVLSRGDRSQARYSPRTPLALVERGEALRAAPQDTIRSRDLWWSYISTARATNWLRRSVAPQAWLNQPQSLVAVDGDNTAVEGKVAPRAEAETGVVVWRIDVEERDLFERAVGDVPRVVDA